MGDGQISLGDLLQVVLAALGVVVAVVGLALNVTALYPRKRRIVHGFLRGDSPRYLMLALGRADVTVAAHSKIVVSFERDLAQARGTDATTPDPGTENGELVFAPGANFTRRRPYTYDLAFEPDAGEPPGDRFRRNVANVGEKPLDDWLAGHRRSVFLGLAATVLLLLAGLLVTFGVAGEPNPVLGRVLFLAAVGSLALTYWPAHLWNRY